jgi:hypothetical protein
MDDGPRTGALQLLILCITAPAALIALSIGTSDLLAAAIPTLIALLGLYTTIRLELYARRRATEEAEARERRLRDARMPPDPFA